MTRLRRVAPSSASGSGSSHPVTPSCWIGPSAVTPAVPGSENVVRSEVRPERGLERSGDIDLREGVEFFECQRLAYSRFGFVDGYQ